jgi:hypothetical protein
MLRARWGPLASCVLLACSLVGCANEAAPSAGRDTSARATPVSLLHDASALGRALAVLTDPLSKPIRALRLSVHPDRILLQVQDPAQPEAVQQYRFKAGEVLGPIPVKLAGPGDLKDNLFPLKYADLKGIPGLAQRAERRAGLEQGRAVAVELQRNLPASMDIRFRVEVNGPGGTRWIEARKDGKVLGVLTEP